jgi:protoporphyrinogen/coproporphyrinogen III oxidase
VDADDDEGKNANKDVKILKATHVISALPLPVLDSILQPQAAATGGASSTHKSPLPHLRANPHSSVTVMNLVFPYGPPSSTGGESTTVTTPLHPPGFGYLIPRPEHGYEGSLASSEPQPGREEEENQEETGPEVGLLGVVFDTASLPDQDHGGENDADAAKFTKLTAMLGGPYLSADECSSSSLSDAQLVQVVLRHISSHLGHALPPPVHYAVHRNAESIPTYLVGHTARMGELRHVLHERWGGMKVVGMGVGGVSVEDCVKAGRQAAYEVGAQIGNEPVGSGV